MHRSVNSITEIHRSFPFSPSQIIEFLWEKDMYNEVYTKSKIKLKPYQTIWVSN